MSKKADFVKELENKDVQSLEQMLLEYSRKLFNLRIKASSDVVTNPMEFRHIRRSIARIKYFLNKKNNNN
jgi:ribosomal protein L29